MLHVSMPLAGGNASIYVIGVETKPMGVKIGVSNRPAKRLHALQAGCPDFLYLAYVSPPMLRAEAFALETTIHKGFSRLALGREWFLTDPDSAEYTIRMLAGLPQADDPGEVI